MLAVNRSILSLGSNIRRKYNLPMAVRLLKQHLSLSVIAASRILESIALPDPSRPNFFNMAVVVETGLSADELKWQVLRELECALGRVRTSDQNSSRTIDIDITFFNGACFDKDSLIYPHIALPLADVAPDFIHPLNLCSLSKIASQFGQSDHYFWSPFQLEESGL